MCCMMGHQEGHPSAIGASPPAEPLLDILRRRYAQGEITQRQLDEMRAVLGLSDGNPGAGAEAKGNPWEAAHHG